MFGNHCNMVVVVVCTVAESLSTPNYIELSHCFRTLTLLPMIKNKFVQLQATINRRQSRLTRSQDYVNTPETPCCEVT